MTHPIEGGLSELISSREKAKPDWASDPDRAPWVTNSLKVRIADLRKAERSCRRAFTKPYFGEMAEYLADCYAEAAEVLERHQAALLKALQDQQVTS
ncbi:hypothetical protein [Phenylobacterium koreense]|uniref:Uncharacterized protein n=1 Tax=Phenylobacterium koreense TaxID=266125 RepID=A0ABV2EJN1_9CAUL